MAEGIAGLKARSTIVPYKLRSPDRAGMIQAFAGATAPSGWMVADGSELPIASFPDLYESIGDTYNTAQYINDSGVVSTYSAPSAGNFRIPNYKNGYLRGFGDWESLDVGGVVDDATAKNGLSNSPSSITGTTTPYTHDHATVFRGTSTSNIGAGDHLYYNRNPSEVGESAYTLGGGSGNPDAGDTSSDNHSHTISSGTAAAQSITGDSETRPKTIAVNYIIKLYHDVADGSVSIAEATATTAGLLKSYEEGTWTPGSTFKENLSGTETITETNYYMVGDIVHASFAVSGLSIITEGARTLFALDCSDLPGMTNTTQFFCAANVMRNPSSAETDSIPAAAYARNTTSSDLMININAGTNLVNSGDSILISNVTFWYKKS